jgi:hypothetical protein
MATTAVNMDVVEEVANNLKGLKHLLECMQDVLLKAIPKLEGNNKRSRESDVPNSTLKKKKTTKTTKTTKTAKTEKTSLQESSSSKLNSSSLIKGKNEKTNEVAAEKTPEKPKKVAAAASAAEKTPEKTKKVASAASAAEKTPEKTNEVASVKTPEKTKKVAEKTPEVTPEKTKKVAEKTPVKSADKKEKVKIIDSDSISFDEVPTQAQFGSLSPVFSDDGKNDHLNGLETVNSDCNLSDVDEFVC